MRTSQGSKAVQLDMTITLGNVIQGGVTVGAVFMAYTAIRERLVRIETQVEPLWRQYMREKGSNGA